MALFSLLDLCCPVLYCHISFDPLEVVSRYRYHGFLQHQVGGGSTTITRDVEPMAKQHCVCWEIRLLRETCVIQL